MFTPGRRMPTSPPGRAWLGALLVVLVLTGGSTFAFLSTEIGKSAMLDQQRADDGVVRREAERRRRCSGWKQRAGARPTSPRSARRSSCR